MNKALLIIFNPAAQAGKSVDVCTEFIAFLEEEKVSYHLCSTTGADDSTPLAELFQLHDFSLISIIGGDGTINLAINSLPHLDLPIHIIPAGSGNDLAKMIYPQGIPSSQQLFARVLNKNPKTTTLDIWRCNGQLFANGFGCGFDGSIAYNAKYKKGIWGSKMKYWVEIVKHIFLYRSPSFSVNGVKQPTFMLSVANGKVYGGDFMVAPHADVSDGNLELVRIHKLNVLKRLLNLPLMKKGGHLKKDFVSYDREHALTIKSNVPLAAHLDGEPMSEKEYRISKEGEMEVLV